MRCGHPALPDRLARAWKTSIGEGASRYTRVLSQPVVAGGRVFAMDGAIQVSALDAATGGRIWAGRSEAGGGARQRLRRRAVLLERPAVRHDRICAGPGARSGRRQGDLAAERHGAGARAADRRGWPGLRGHASRTRSTCCRPMTGARCGRITAFPRPPACSAAPARRSRGDRRGRPTARASCSRCGVENGRVDLVRQSGRDARPSTRSPAWPISAAGRSSIAAGSSRSAIAAAWRRSTCAPATASGSSRSAAATARGSAGDFIFVLASDNEAVCLTRDDGKVRWVRPLPRFRGREEEVRPDLLGRPGARRQPADRAVLDRRD